jgi:predicted ABC-type transport system involved in lysophospholipase L1 biosynthesis ATPase subunit
LNAEGQTIIMVTHDERIAARVSRTIRLADGKVKDS